MICVCACVYVHVCSRCVIVRARALFRPQGPKPFAIKMLLQHGYLPLHSHLNDVYFVHSSLANLEDVMTRLGNNHGIRVEEYVEGVTAGGGGGSPVPSLSTAAL